MSLPAASHVATVLLTYYLPNAAPSQPVLSRRRCTGIIQWLMHSSFAQHFAEPVDPIALALPTYHEVITQPMDLGTVLALISGDNVFVFDDFLAAIRLVWSNAMRFNPSSNTIHKMAHTLAELFEERVQMAQSHPMDDDAVQLYNVLAPLVNGIRQLPNAVIFACPVDSTTNVDYYQTIAYPICLDEVHARIVDDAYTERHEVQADVRRVWENAIEYNGDGHFVTRWALGLQQDSDALMIHRMDDIDRQFVAIPQQRIQLAENMQQITDDERILALSKMRGFGMYAVHDDAESGVSSLIIDNLTQKEFLQVDMFVRACIAKKLVLKRGREEPVW